MTNNSNCFFSSFAYCSKSTNPIYMTWYQTNMTNYWNFFFS